MKREKMTVLPRKTPNRDARYMGLAWIHASFSKDPSTQVGAVIVSKENYILGSGYNGPPRIMNDDEVNWSRPPKDDPDAFSKYDIMIHAEQNAIDYSSGSVRESTIYVTAMPCPICMKELVRGQVSRIVYFDFQSNQASMLQNQRWREKSLELARLGKISMERFEGQLDWLPDWVSNLKELGVLAIPESLGTK
jgi:dCMP deaminase